MNTYPFRFNGHNTKNPEKHGRACRIYRFEREGKVVLEFTNKSRIMSTPSRLTYVPTRGL